MVKKNQKEYEETEAMAKVRPVGRDEFSAAGQKGFKAEFMIEVWAFEYSGQKEAMVGGERYAIYRTYGPKPNGKTELYLAERVGKNDR